MNHTESHHREFLVGICASLAALALLGTTVGCAPTALVNVWRDPSIAPPRLNNLLVIAIRKDATRRRMWEDAFSMQLSKYGVTAMASYRLYPNAAPDTLQIREALGSRDFNGVLSVNPLPPKYESEFVPGYTSLEPDIWYSPFWGRYYWHWYYVHNPGYIETFAARRYEIDVYMTRGTAEQMVWSGTSEMVEPSTMEEVRSSVVQQVVSKLAEQGVIPARH